MPKKSHFTEAQIIHALARSTRAPRSRTSCEKLGVTETTFYRWKSKFGGMDVSDAKRLKAVLRRAV